MCVCVMVVGGVRRTAGASHSLLLSCRCSFYYLDHGARPGALGAGNGHDLRTNLNLELHAGGDARGDLHLHYLRHSFRWKMFLDQ